MSGDTVGRILTRARLPESPSKTKIGTAELQAAWAEARRPEAGDPADKPLHPSEAKLFLDLKDTDLTAGARRYLRDVIKPTIPRLLQGTTPVGGPNVPVTPVGSKRPVFVNADGYATPLANQTGVPALPQAEEGLYRLALTIAQSVQNGGKVPAFDALPLATRAKVVDTALALAKQSADANGALAGLDANQTQQLRSSAFTVLWYVATQVDASTQLHGRIHGELVKLADAEPQKFLGKHLARMLDRPEYRNKLSADQKKDVTEVFDTRHPQKFDVGNILDAQGFISWEHVAGEGENFYRSEITNLLKESLGGGKFAKVRSGAGYTDFELKFNPPRGDNGRVKGVRMRVREFANDMFDSVGQRKGFSYGGHSNIGQNQEASLVNAIAKGLKANQPQLAILDLCGGLDNLDDGLENLGNVEVLTTFGSSFFWKGTLKDEFGNSFEGVRDSEGSRTLMAAFESLSREEDYGQMRRRISDEIYNYAHMRNPNVVFPTIEDYREVRWMHLDGDNDGRMDSDDVLFQFGLQKASRDPNREFVLRDNGPSEKLNGDAVKDAALDLNVATHYNASVEGSAVEHKFQGAGWFESSNPAELVRFAPGTNHDGKPVFEVSVNSGLAHVSREALAALVQYSAIVQMADQGKLNGLDETNRKLMGLTFAAFRLNSDGQGRQNDQRIWTQLLQVLRLPSELPYGGLASALDAEHHDYSGNLKVVNDYKKQLSPATVAKLAVPGVGRPGDGAPTAPIA